MLTIYQDVRMPDLVPVRDRRDICCQFALLRKVMPGSDYVLTVRGSVEANNGETLGQLAAEGDGITRVRTETVGDAIRSGDLVPLLEEFNPGDVEEIHAVFIGGVHMPARVRCFVDYLVERLRSSNRAGSSSICRESSHAYPSGRPQVDGW